MGLFAHISDHSVVTCVPLQGISYIYNPLSCPNYSIFFITFLFLINTCTILYAQHLLSQYIILVWFYLCYDSKPHIDQVDHLRYLWKSSSYW